MVLQSGWTWLLLQQTFDVGMTLVRYRLRVRLSLTLLEWDRTAQPLQTCRCARSFPNRFLDSALQLPLLQAPAPKGYVSHAHARTRNSLVLAYQGIAWPDNYSAHLCLFRAAKHQLPSAKARTGGYSTSSIRVRSSASPKRRLSVRYENCGRSQR